MDDRELLTQLRERGPRVGLMQRRVYDHYAPQFFAFLRRRGVPEADRQDIVQQAFLKVFSSIDAVLNSSNPRSYVWTILVRSHHDWYRQNFRKVPVGPDANGDHRFRYVRKESRASEIEIEGTDWFDIEGIEPAVDSTYGRLEDDSLHDCFERASRAFLKAHPHRAPFIELHVVAQMTDAEIAEAIGRTKHATAQFLSQCRRLFLDTLRSMCGPGTSRSSAVTA